jgi:hypothetical protein
LLFCVKHILIICIHFVLLKKSGSTTGVATGMKEPALQLQLDTATVTDIATATGTSTATAT